MAKLVAFGPGEVQSGKDKGKKRFLNFALPKLTVDEVKHANSAKNDKGVLTAAVSPADIMIPEYDMTPEGLQEIITEIGDEALSAKLLVESVNTAIVNASRSKANAAAIGFTTGEISEAITKIIAAAGSVTLRTLLEESQRGPSGTVKQAKENASQLQTELAKVNGDMSQLSPEMVAKLMETIALLTK